MSSAVPIFKKTKHVTVYAMVGACMLISSGKDAYAFGPVFDAIVNASVLSVGTGVGTVATAVGLTNTAVGLTNTQLKLIQKSLVGLSMTANLHADINEVNGSVNQNTKAIATALKMMGKNQKFYAERKIYAKTEMLGSSQSSESNCQSTIVANAVQKSGSSKGGSPTAKANLTALTMYEESRRKTMRDQIADMNISVAQHEANFCSESDAISGLCKKSSVCPDGSQSCKASADQDAALFMADGYESQVHQDGAVQFISHLVDPYPTEKPKASTVRAMDNASSERYKYDNIVHESKASVARSLLNELWQERINISTDQATQDVLTSISDYDSQSLETAKKYLKVEYMPSSYKPYFKTLGAINPVYNAVSKAIAPVPHMKKGKASRLQMLEFQVDMMYGNRAWEAQLRSGDGMGRVAMGRALSLQNKLTLMVIKKIDRLILAEATTLANANSSSQNVSKSGRDAIAH